GPPELLTIRTAPASYSQLPGRQPRKVTFGDPDHGVGKLPISARRLSAYPTKTPIPVEAETDVTLETAVTRLRIPSVATSATFGTPPGRRAKSRKAPPRWPPPFPSQGGGGCPFFPLHRPSLVPPCGLLTTVDAPAAPPEREARARPRGQASPRRSEPDDERGREPAAEQPGCPAGFHPESQRSTVADLRALPEAGAIHGGLRSNGRTGAAGCR